MKTQTHTCQRAGVGRRARGYTLIEALAAIAVLLIVIPVLLQGFSIAGMIATAARQRADATALAQSRLDEIIATQSWQAGMQDETVREGVYDYQCTPSLESWDSGEVNIQLLRMTVSWETAGGTRHVTLSSLVWQPSLTEQTSGTGVTGVLP
jgi:type II secretory pathway pseudopilin PulG